MAKSADQLDMEHRDVNQLNSHIQVSFEEIFGEPDTAHSIDCVWRNSYKCYNCTLSCCYKFLTVLCAIPLAFCWACEFACTTCYHVWYVTPYIKALAIALSPIARINRMILDACLAPCCETCGMVFSKVQVKNT